MRGESIIKPNINLGFQWLYQVYVWEMVGRSEDGGYWMEGGIQNMSRNGFVTSELITELITLSVMFSSWSMLGYGIIAVYVGILKWKLEVQLSK